MSSTADVAGSSAWSRRIAWLVVVVMVALVPVNVVLAGLAHMWGLVVQAIPFATFPVVGAVLAFKRPSNPLGWLMLAIGFVWSWPLELYAEYALHVRHGSIPGGAYALAISGPGWVPFIGLSGFLLLLFPDGHVPSPRWRWFAWTCGIGLALLFLVILFAPGRFTDSGFPRVSNPLGIEAMRPFFGPLLALVASAPLVVLGGAAAVVVRMRRSRDDVERHQLRWLAWTAAVVAAFYLLAFVPNAILDVGWSNAFGTIAVFGFALIPVSIGIAVLRYRLYDIDVVIRKTVVVAAIAVFFTAVYLAVVGGIGALVQTHSTTALSFLAAAVVAALFQPVLSTARRLADRLVYGRRSTPYEVLAAFSGRVGDAYATEDVLGRMAQILGQGVGATTARVWLRIGSTLRPAAAWPHHGERPRPVPLTDDDVADPEGDLSVEVRDRGELLGALSVAMPTNDPMTPAKEKLMRDLAAQAGLVLRNVRLVEELKALQRRIVTAQDHERRRLERNIHDGAQQQLIALAVKARLARSLLDRDLDRAGEMLDQIGAETQDALENLRDLARGIYPPLLADKGLVAALDAQVRKAAVDVELASDGVGRYPQEVEAAVYFSILEALQNAAKYAEATSVEVRVAEHDGRLTFEVRDDGGGFDPDANGYGTGLQGIADRLAALDGTLAVRSAPGSGTRVAGAIPIA